MPLYEFKCNHCDHRFDDLVKYGTQVTQCPECGSWAEYEPACLSGNFSLSGGGLGWAASGYDRNYALRKDKDDPTGNK